MSAHESTTESESTDTMPERYRPDPVIEAAVSRASKGAPETPSGKVPIIALRDWVGCEPPTTLSIAPRDETSVRIGAGVPSILDDLTVGEAMKYNGRYPTATLPLSVLEYMGATPGDRLEVEHVDDGTLEVRLLKAGDNS